MNLIHNLVWFPRLCFEFSNCTPIYVQQPRPRDSGDRLKWKNVFSQTRHKVCFFSVMIGAHMWQFSRKTFLHDFSLERFLKICCPDKLRKFFREFLWFSKKISRWSNDQVMRFCISSITPASGAVDVLWVELRKRSLLPRSLRNSI